MWRLCFCILSMTISCNGQSSSNKVWILLEDTTVYQCRGINNRFRISDKDVSIRNSQGRPVHYLEAPGTYVLRFNNIQVDEPLPNLSGQINGVLQVPIVEVGHGILNWDMPYQLIPEKQIFGGYKCDKASGAVQDEKMFCRYCDLCTTSDQVDDVVNSKHKFLPKVGSQSEPDFEKICVQVEAKSYTIQRTISLPDRAELEREANAQFGNSIQGELKKKLNKGKGKMQMELQVMSSDQHQEDRNTVYQGSQKCRCCLNSNNFYCKLGPLGGSCNQDTCNGEYASKCMRGRAEKVGCYTVQFNYQVTDKPDQVKAFLQRNHYEDEYHDFDGLASNGPIRAPQPAPAPTNPHETPVRNNPAPANTREAIISNTNNGNTGSGPRACINAIKEDRFKKYCEMRWQPNFCCGLCSQC